MSKCSMEKEDKRIRNSEVEPRLISLKIQTPDGTIIESSRKHNPAFHTDKSGQQYMVDYDVNFPRIQSDGNHIDLSIYDSSSFELVRDTFKWGSYGKDGVDELHLIKLKDLSDDHVKAIIDGGYAGLNDYLFKMEMEYREK